MNYILILDCVQLAAISINNKKQASPDHQPKIKNHQPDIAYEDCRN